ncbi:sensor histidine kinase [Zooshikella harenae]|uniref:histidine kinase n=1 Tax=Zooshikella harenae TaxID=2827238 RepID=A0ABS5ZE87_9GAMM|nr:HAMP domain-containing sensor histidine kinase [Zooshikella harenae]MBU2712053.1 HAMP domain-containing histidine kinase [Zooshikella harenae]
MSLKRPVSFIRHFLFRLPLFACLGLWLVITLAWCLVYPQVNNAILAELAERVMGLADPVIDELLYDEKSNKVVRLSSHDFVEKLVENLNISLNAKYMMSNIYVQVVDNKKQILYFNLHQFISKPIIQPLWKDFEIIEVADTHFFVYIFKLADGGVFKIGSNANDAIEFVEYIQTLIYYIVICTFIVALLLGIFLQYRQSRKVNDILRYCDLAKESPHIQLHFTMATGEFKQIFQRINELLLSANSKINDLQDFSAKIAHDMRSPLTRLRGQLEFLLNQKNIKHKDIELLLSEIERLEKNFSSLMTISQLESKSFEQRDIKFDYRQLMVDLKEMYQPVCEDHDIKCHWQLCDKPVWQMGNPNLWFQALSNIIDNALKFTPTRGHIAISLDGHYEPIVSIADSGSGIPEHERENVFKRFYRMEKHYRVQGSGLGLSMVKAICKYHNAQISLEGDHGLTVKIKLDSLV